MINVGINGFGRIGKLAARMMLDHPSFRVVSVNHPTLTRDDFLKLLKYDSVHGRYSMNDRFVNMVNIHNNREPEDIHWEDNLDMVLDTTGLFKEKDSVMKHLLNTNSDPSCPTKVVVSAPSKSLPMFIYGANHEKYNGEQFISASSCTTTCLAPIMKIIDENYAVESGLATTIHAVTASQFTVDKYKPGKRIGRTILNNIIPSTTGSASSIGKILPHLDGKVNAISVRVPVQDVSLLDLTLNIPDEPELEDIFKLFRKKQGLGIRICRESLVSSDFIGDPNSATIDTESCLKQGSLYKIVAWYDNEMGYLRNIMRLMQDIHFNHTKPFLH
jgi:glyceraldehyde 3-phosphate dehydrogenase